MTLYFISKTGVVRVMGHTTIKTNRILKVHGYHRVTKTEYLRKQKEIRQAEALIVGIVEMEESAR